MIDRAHELAIGIQCLMASYPNLSQFHWDRIIQIAGADVPDLIGPEVK
jgi:hypothetical protein